MTHSHRFRPRQLAWLAIAPALAALAVRSDARTIRDHRDPSTGGGAYTLMVTPVVDLVVTFAPGQATSCSTSNLSTNADPIIHVLEVRGGPVVELARGDDQGGDLNARVDFTAPADGRVRIVMRAAAAFTGGTADLTCTGFQPLRGLSVGGAFKTIENYRDRDKLMTVPLAGGPMAHTGYILDSNGRMLHRHVTGAEGTAFLDAPGVQPANFQVMLGSYAGDVRLTPSGRFPGGAIVGGVRAPAVRADAQTQPAPTPSAPRGPRIPDIVANPPIVAEIVRVADPPGEVRLVRNDLYIAGHDPDGDGLGSELEAHIGTCSARTGIAGNWECSRTFDARDTDGDGLTDRAELIGIVERAPYQWLPRWGADPRHKDLFLEVDFMQRERNEAPRKLARARALEIAAIYGDPEQSPLFRLAHAQALNNPDLKAGISVHLDIGTAPPADAPKAELTIYGDWGGHNLVAAVCVPMPIVATARMRVPEGVRAPQETCRGASASEVWQTAMHENRRGVFHYVLGYPGSGGQASMHTFVLNMPIDDSAVAAHELGHTLGLTHSGPEGVGADANCKPNYPSLMSYSYLGRVGFSDGYGRAALNNTKLTERGAVGGPGSGPGRAYLEHMRDIYRYNIDLTAGDVDWNRDGVMSTTPVRAYANNDHSSCEFTRVNWMEAEGLADGALALARLSGRTFVLYIDERDRKLHAETTDNSLACPTIGNGCGPPLVHHTVDQPWNADWLAFDAQAMPNGRLLVVFRTAQGLFETTMTRELAFTPPVAIVVGEPAVGELSLAGAGSTMWLAFRDASGAARLKQRASSGAWSADEIATETGGQAIALAEGSAPGLLHAGGVLYGVFPVAPQGGLRLYTHDPASGRWARSPWAMSQSPSIGRPALAMEPVASGSPLPGRLRILYLQRRADGNAIVRIKTLEAIGLAAGAQRELTDEIFDNVWYYGKGVDLLFEAGVDSNLRALVATAITPGSGPAPHVIQLRPKADGVVDFTYRNWNDWEALGIDLCRTLKLAGALPNCPAWPYTPQPQPQPPPPPPPGPSATCLAQCNELYDSCRAAGESGSACVRQRAQCRASCGP